MSWNYSGDPSSSEKDEVRFLSGDTNSNDPLVQDEEIMYTLGEQPSPMLAAALVLRALASKFSKMATQKIGDISKNCSDISKAFAERANELDPDGITVGVSLVLPSFGGLKISEKETLAEDTDAVQPSFSKGMDDIPGGPDDVSRDFDEYL